MQWRKSSLFSEWCWENWPATCKGMTDTFFLTIYKSKLKIDKGLNVRLKSIKLLGNNIGRILLDINHSNIF